MDTPARARLVAQFVKRNHWMDSPFTVTFLAAGEYNENWVVESSSCKAVLRINHGTQINQQDQTGYEYRVLELLQHSGVTPAPMACHSATDSPELPGHGVLLMQYLPGGPLVYERDLEAAAHIFARVHSVPVPANHGLLSQPNPVVDIAAESLGLIHRYPDHPQTQVKDRLLTFHEHILSMGQEYGELFAQEPQVLVNTEVNSHNFLMNPDKSGDQGHHYLVDWEKAVISCRYQDLGHFLVETTTRWKTSTVLSPEQKKQFLRAYARRLHELENGLTISFNDLALRTALLERTILLRALSWCYMAWYEYTTSDRALQHTQTLQKMESYLHESERLLEWPHG